MCQAMCKGFNPEQDALTVPCPQVIYILAQWFLNINILENHLENLFKTQMASSFHSYPCRNADLVDLERIPRIYLHFKQTSQQILLQAVHGHHYEKSWNMTENEEKLWVSVSLSGATTGDQNQYDYLQTNKQVSFGGKIILSEQEILDDSQERITSNSQATVFQNI